MLDDEAADEGVLEATDDIDDATLDDMAATEDMLGALDEVAVCLVSLLPPQPLSTTAM